MVESGMMLCRGHLEEWRMDFRLRVSGVQLVAAAVSKPEESSKAKEWD